MLTEQDYVRIKEYREFILEGRLSYSRIGTIFKRSVEKAEIKRKYGAERFLDGY